MNAPYDLTSRVALVTGGTRGIGLAIARELMRCGAHVVVSSRKPEGVAEAVTTLRAGAAAEGPGGASGIPAHVGRIEECHALVDRVLAEAGRLDVLVNNAATNPVYGPVEDTSPEAFAKIIEVNLRGPFELARRALPAMKAQGRGAIVNISSIGGRSPESGLGVYSVSKAALISLTQVMASEWGPHGVRANAICPGFIRTAFSRALWTNSGIMDAALGRQAIARIGEPEDVAGLAVFLASDAAAFCTGGVFTVDGGYLI